MCYMKVKYTILENPPYDKEAPKTFWIKKETVRFGFIKSFKIIGDYRINDTYGELGDMPFFDKKSAKKRIKILNK